MNDQKRTCQIDYRLELYKTFFGFEWAKRIDALAKGTKLESPLMSLFASWRGAANTHALPWVMVHSLGAFWRSTAKFQGPTAQLVATLAAVIPQRVKLTVTKQQELRRVLQGYADEVREACNKSPDPEMEPEAFWREYLEKPEFWEFKMAVWGSQQLVFVALYFAFEHFVTSLVAIGLGKSDYTPPWHRVVADAKELLDPVDPALVPRTLEDKFIETARQTRHCLAHNGGRESDKLKATGHHLLVQDGIIQIMAPDNWKLVRALEQRVLDLTEAAAKLGQFQAAAAS